MTYRSTAGLLELSGPKRKPQPKPEPRARLTPATIPISDSPRDPHAVYFDINYGIRTQT